MSGDFSELAVVATFLKTAAWLAQRFGFTRSEFRRWALVAWEQEHGPR